jgi:hypothetical protein
MGLITGLFTWPVAPVRGVAWVAEQVRDEAERQWADPAVIERALADIDARRSSGELDDEEAAAMEEELVARLLDADRGRHD